MTCSDGLVRDLGRVAPRLPTTYRSAVSSDPRRHSVIVIGGGFGGLWAGRRLARHGVDVLLIDRNNYHTFFPLLYQVAAAELEPEDIAYPIRGTLRNLPSAGLVMADVRGLDAYAHTLETNVGAFGYDYLVLAIGSRPNFFGVPGAREHSFTLRSLEEAVALRNHILSRFEAAAIADDPETQRRLLTFAIVGGGPTGVEFAGALAELIRGPLSRDHRELDLRARSSVVLIEAGPSLLPSYGPCLRRYAEERLRALGVQVRTSTAVERIGARRLDLKDTEAVEAETMVWTAGVRGDPAIEGWQLPLARGGRVDVLPTLQVEQHPEVYVVGDLALARDAERPLPQVAPVATQQGETAARNILRRMDGQPQKPFRYRDKGTLAVIGRNAAVGEVFGQSFSGVLAWLLWLGIHIFQLIGFRNRLIVLTSWAWDYVFFERVVRLILPRVRLGDGPPPD